MKNESESTESEKNAQRREETRRKKKEEKERDKSEQRDKVAREYMSPRHPPRLVQQLPAPPPVLGRRGHRDDIARLEVELLRDRRRIIIQRFHCTNTTDADQQSAHQKKKK